MFLTNEKRINFFLDACKFSDQCFDSQETDRLRRIIGKEGKLFSYFFPD